MSLDGGFFLTPKLVSAHSAWAVTFCAADPRYFHFPPAADPTGVRAPSVGARHELPLWSGYLGSCHKPFCRKSSVLKGWVAQGGVQTTRAECVCLFALKPC